MYENGGTGVGAQVAKSRQGMKRMPERRTPAVFYRGGTSKAVFFQPKDLPEDGLERDQLLLHVLGSPDPYGRQLNGMGGGLSSVSKAMMVERSRRNDADIDYTFAQVAIDKPVVDYSANCGNMTSAVGQFAVEEGIFPVPDGDAVVRMYNTNTDICVHSHFRVEGGRAVTEGDLEIPGVPGTGAPVKLEFMDPARVTGCGLLPSGKAQEVLDVPGFGEVAVSIVDAAALGVFVPAEAFGLEASELPEEIEARTRVMEALDFIRREAAVRAGMCQRPEDAPLSAPRVALVAPPKSFTALDGRPYFPDQFDIAVRMASLGTIHRAVMVTGAMCVAAATFVEGSVPNRCASGLGPDGAVRLGNPSGVTVMGASVAKANGIWTAQSTSVMRTCRRLMDGHVYHP
jgi:2-methylaconitate cis-trans-isomerase PrpF